MDYKIAPDNTAKNLYSKANMIDNIKDRFYQIIQRKIGDLLVDEISRITGTPVEGAGRLIFLKIPHFLKSIFSFYDDDQFLIETSFLYILFSLEKMNQELQVIYDQYLQKIMKNQKDLLELSDIIRINSTREPESVCKFEIPSYLKSSYAMVSDEFNDLIIFGLVKIFEWMNIFSPDLCTSNPHYEQAFLSVLRALSDS
ncbi:MAG: hypothetical protein ACTSQI_11420 [Candidatus Helarchaeota archaeon]